MSESNEQGKSNKEKPIRLVNDLLHNQTGIVTISEFGGTDDQVYLQLESWGNFSMQAWISRESLTAIRDTINEYLLAHIDGQLKTTKKD